MKCDCKSTGGCPKCINGSIRVFDTGGNRDTDKGKIDFEGCMSPLVIQKF
jgi:hypothetical protein